MGADITPAREPARAITTFDRFWADWMKALAIPTTRAAYAAAVRRMQPYLYQEAGLSLPLGRITPGQAQAAYEACARDYSVAAANLSRAALAHLYRHARAVGLPAPDVWAHVKERRPKEALAERILSEGEVRRLIAAADPGLPRLALLWLYLTGQRASEAIAVRGRDFRHTEQGWVVTTYGKGGKTRWIRLPDRLIQAVARERGWPLPADLALFPVSRQTLWRWVKAAAVRAHLTDRVSPHWMRHAHASHALDHGVPIHWLRQELGHHSLSITERYLHVAPGGGSADRLPWPGPDA
jgi:integrase/recombinase XerD